MRTSAALVLLCTCVVSASLVNAQTPQGLRIVVIEGENAVNIVQQKSAVAPVIEVRDRNDQPVVGATVRFAIRAGRATFGGPRTLAVTTNSAGRAAVATLTPTGSGAIQITATAAFQGETAAVTIAQTNVLTAAAAGASSGAGAGGAAGGAGGGGGGVSGTTVAVVGGAAAGGAVTAVKLAAGPEPAPPTTTRYTGNYSMTYTRVFTSRTSSASCSYTITAAGTMTLNVTDDKGSVSGDFNAQGTETVVSVNGCSVTVGSTVNFGYQSTLTGSTTSFGGSKNNTGTGASGNTVSQTLTFTASVSASVVTGTIALNDRLDSAIDVGVGSATTAITLR